MFSLLLLIVLKNSLFRKVYLGKFADDDDRSESFYGHIPSNS